MAPPRAAIEAREELEVDGVDFNDYSVAVRRRRSNFQARRRRLERSQPSILRLREAWREAQKALNQMEDRLERIYVAEYQKVSGRPEIRAARAQRKTAARREARARRIYEASVEEILGAFPPASPLEQLLMDQVLPDGA